jgi:hypothetical protein
MPDEVFGRFYELATFHRYPSLFETTHKKEGRLCFNIYLFVKPSLSKTY